MGEPLSIDFPLESITGHCIVAVEVADHPVLTLDDGRRITFEGIGYDGLWTDVSWYVEVPVCPTCESDDPAVHKPSNAYASPADYPDDKLCPDPFHGGPHG